MNNEQRLDRILEDEAYEHKMKAFTKEIEYLSIPDIRNKLSPMTNMIALFERGEYDYISLDEVKRSINYLCQRDVYETKL